MFTGVMPSTLAAVLAGAGMALLAAAGPDKLIVLVCRSRSGAGGIARLTDWSVLLVEGGLLENIIGTNRMANATSTAAPNRRVFKTDSRQPLVRDAADYTCPCWVT
ncbi:hypothetical protein GCM10010981_36430 [Dyella nitratireducens]|uniref:Uncharacterized protein n=1 Tax=Dyella nitratireducens TaxID=1849580 RepID=A0ABQ1GI11_9GAMM|nr:hypothetical protein GCM10010981_36430 [Dyella nitratireducens]GLQ41800.1 hypothetical protein GCM10007902_16500 [Dyella nitratireducens]